MRRRKYVSENGEVSFGKWRVTADLTDENADKFLRLTKNSVLNESKIINNLIAKVAIPSSYPLAPTHKELQSFRLEINKIGNNINQIAKRLNSEKAIPDKVIRHHLSEIDAKMTQLLLLSEEIKAQTTTIVDVITK